MNLLCAMKTLSFFKETVRIKWLIPFVFVFLDFSDEEAVTYGSKAGYLSRSQMSSNCSTTGSSSSRGSTGSRGLNSARKHNEVGYSDANDYMEVKNSLCTLNGFNNWCF